MGDCRCDGLALAHGVSGCRAVIVKKVDAQTRSKASINELLLD